MTRIESEYLDAQMQRALAQCVGWSDEGKTIFVRNRMNEAYEQLWAARRKAKALVQ